MLLRNSITVFSKSYCFDLVINSNNKIFILLNYQSKEDINNRLYDISPIKLYVVYNY